ncbi:hypothetical protein ON010_g11071 [Phytophthora cinnamomi]|nr:hypothetical protein ON010_g11071 [Phytophthora cinnamomi]
MEVLRERQQETSKTEARRIRRLVHERTALLEDELAKGKLDLDYIAQVVSSTCRRELKQEAERETNQNAMSSVKTLVKDVQDRRQRDFETAEANFQARMRSFQLEKEALAKKANELRVTKQRALQILSQNQQQVIKVFFDTQVSQNREEKAPITPTLDFGEILQSLYQSGAQVEHIQTIDSERNSDRRELIGALQQARATLEHGNQRVEAIQKSLLDRKTEAQKLGITVESSETTGYDGVWGIESYAPRQFETVYFVRGLIFSCMDAAIAEVRTQPAKELLEYEVKRWSDTHFSVEQDRDRERVLQFARQTLANLMDEVITEISEDLRSEFESSANCVRSVVTTAIKSALFPNRLHKLESLHTKKTITKSHTAAPASASPPALRSLLFESSFDHLRSLRNRRNDSSSTTILHRTSLPVIQRETAKTVISSPVTTNPAKKTFSLFSSSKGAEKVSKTEVLTDTHSSTAAGVKPSKLEDIPFFSICPPTPLPSSAKLAIKFWENDPHLRSQTIVVPSSLGCSSCVQVSPHGDLLICGTTEGELIIWDLLPDQPAILCTWSPPKAERSRIIRVVLSADSQVVMAFFRRRTVSVFAINSARITTVSQAKAKQATHSEDCFPVESSKFKPRNLEVLVQLSVADALAELPFSRDLCERAPNAVAKNSARVWSAAELCSGSFFATSSLTGITTCSTSILFGASTGDLLKLNLQPQRASNDAWLHSIQATFDSPSSEDNEALDTKSIRREFFRGHRGAVVFASCIHRESEAPEVLSVDQDGVVCIWKYIAEEFSGFGWFKPTLRTRLELSSDFTTSTAIASVVSASKQLRPKQTSSVPDKFPGVLNGEVLQVGLTPDDSRLVFMIFYGDQTKKEVTGTLRFLQLLTISMQLDRVQLDVNFVGGNGVPRFAVTTNFLFLLANNRVRVYTLRAGKEARDPIALSASGKQQLAFNSISCTTTSSFSVTDNLGSTKLTSRRNTDPTTITLVVSGDQHSRVIVLSFTSSAPQKSVMTANAKRER